MHHAGCPALLPPYSVLPGYGCLVSVQPLAPGATLPLLACHTFSVMDPPRDRVPWEPYCQNEPFLPQVAFARELYYSRRKRNYGTARVCQALCLERTRLDLK